MVHETAEDCSMLDCLLVILLLVCMFGLWLYLDSIIVSSMGQILFAISFRINKTRLECLNA